MPVHLLKCRLGQFLCVLLFLMCSPVFSARADSSPAGIDTFSNTVVVSISGQISKNVLLRIKKNLAGVTADPLPAGLIVLLDSPGGDGMAAMEIGRLLRASNAHVFVTGQCSSACIFVLAAGVVRGAASLSVGIHRGRITMSDADAKILSDVDVSKNAEAQKFLNRYELAAETYLDQMGMSPALFETMQIHQQKGAYHLDSKQLSVFKLTGYEPVYLASRVELYKKNKNYFISDSDELVRRTAKVASYCAKYDLKPIEFFECYKTVLSDPYLN